MKLKKKHFLSNNFLLERLKTPTFILKVSSNFILHILVYIMTILGKKNFHAINSMQNNKRRNTSGYKRTQKQLIKQKTKLDQTNTNDTPSISKTIKDNTKLKTKCNYCQKEFSGLKIHLEKNPIFRVKRQESTKQHD